MSNLIALSGLPGVGKTTLARELALRTNAIHLRVDSVEAALKNCSLNIHPAEDAGYVILASVAMDNLLLGFDVIVDTVNPIQVTRNLWTETAKSAGAALVNVEVVCEDEVTHRGRVTARKSDLKGLEAPTWEDVINRTFEPWQQERITVDTSKNSISECAVIVENALGREERLPNIR